jgi:hypothetical protein
MEGEEGVSGMTGSHRVAGTHTLSKCERGSKIKAMDVQTAERSRQQRVNQQSDVETNALHSPYE